MKTSEEVYTLLKDKFGDAIGAHVTGAPKEPIIEVQAGAIREAGFFLRDTEGLEFDNLILITALDDDNGKRENLPDGGFSISGGTLSVVYHLESTRLKHKAVLRVTVPRENPEAESVCEVWQHANYEEREGFDMIGITFLNHPDHRRILMPYDWEAGYPLRKDYQNPEFYQGMKVPY